MFTFTRWVWFLIWALSLLNWSNIANVEAARKEYDIVLVIESENGGSTKAHEMESTFLTHERVGPSFGYADTKPPRRYVTILCKSLAKYIYWNPDAKDTVPQGIPLDMSGCLKEVARIFGSDVLIDRSNAPNVVFIFTQGDNYKRVFDNELDFLIYNRSATIMVLHDKDSYLTKKKEKHEYREIFHLHNPEKQVIDMKFSCLRCAGDDKENVYETIFKNLDELLQPKSIPASIHTEPKHQTHAFIHTEPSSASQTTVTTSNDTTILIALGIAFVVIVVLIGSVVCATQKRLQRLERKRNQARKKEEPATNQKSQYPTSTTESSTATSFSVANPTNRATTVQTKKASMVKTAKPQKKK